MHSQYSAPSTVDGETLVEMKSEKKSEPRLFLISIALRKQLFSILAKSNIQTFLYFRNYIVAVFYVNHLSLLNQESLFYPLLF